MSFLLYLTHFTSRVSCAQSLELGGWEPLLIHKSGWFLKKNVWKDCFEYQGFDLFGLVIQFFSKYMDASFSSTYTPKKGSVFRPMALQNHFGNEPVACSRFLCHLISWIMEKHIKNNTSFDPLPI